MSEMSVAKNKDYTDPAIVSRVALLKLVLKKIKI